MFGMYLTRFLRRACSSRRARFLARFTRNWAQQPISARLTDDSSSDTSSPTYSFEVPLKGIFVLTMLTYTPTLSLRGSMWYAVQFIRFVATCVTTSAPASNSRGMRLANRYTLMPSRTCAPPSDTAASTRNGCPSCTPALSEKVATMRGFNSFITPKRMLYSPAGLRHCPLGGRICFSSRRVWISAATCEEVREVGLFPVILRLSAMRRATACVTPASACTRKLSTVGCVRDCSRLERVMLFSDLGCGSTSCAMGGICSERRSKSARNDFFPSLWHWKSIKRRA
mmetsp:Transcript_11479/g.25473  ORF Transcript_11479/g.25473 Transcript_11479/m.25473 type:complete len:284 (+) Transcript_11479:235-1086(+)